MSASVEMAYHYAESDDGTWFLVVCFRGERGYHIYGDRPVEFATRKEASDCARRMNRRLGLTRHEANIIIGSTMRPPEAA